MTLGHSRGPGGAGFGLQAGKANPDALTQSGRSHSPSPGRGFDTGSADLEKTRR